MKDSISIEAKRKEALKNLAMISRITEEKYFADISTAIDTKDEALWMQTCGKAGIPEDLMEYLWKLINGTKISPGIIWFVPQRPPEEKPKHK